MATFEFPVSGSSRVNVGTLGGGRASSEGLDLKPARAFESAVVGDALCEDTAGEGVLVLVVSTGLAVLSSLWT